jgi:hypothetical protein
MRSASSAYRRRSKGEAGRIPTARWGLKEAWSKRAKGPSERLGTREMNLRGDGRMSASAGPPLPAHAEARQAGALELFRAERVTPKAQLERFGTLVLKEVSI